MPCFLGATVFFLQRRESSICCVRAIVARKQTSRKLTMTTTKDSTPRPQPGLLIIFYIGKEPFKIDSSLANLSVRTLLTEYAKENPNETTLARKHGNELHKYTNLDEIVHITNETKFVVLHNSPTPVT